VASAAYPGSVTEDDREREQDRFAELRRTEDPRLRDELVEEHLWLARHCSRRFAGKGEPRDDLEQVASLALVKSVDRFDPSFGVRFSTFAVPTIMGELRRHFRDRTWSVRVTRRLKDLHLELKAANELLSQDLGRAPTVDEVLEALEAGASYRASSLVVAGPDDDEHALDLAADDEELGSAGVRVALAEAMRTLPDRERRVVYLRFYLGLSQSEIAERIGVSQVHVSRILRASLSQLEEELGSPDLLEQ
jgi:RNA polymerase sigma-B factor